jgi:hypothetical protein
VELQGQEAEDELPRTKSSTSADQTSSNGGYKATATAKKLTGVSFAPYVSHLTVN